MISNDNINDTGFDEFNAIFAGSVSLFFNLLLMFVTSKVQIFSDTVKRMQMLSSVLRLFFSITVVLCSPTLAYIIEAEAVYIVKGGFSLGMTLGKSLLIAFLTFVIFSCLGPPMQFIQVVFIVKKTTLSQRKLFLITFIASFIISLIATLFIFLGYSPDAFDDQLSEDYVYNLNGKGKAAYLIASLERYDYNKDDFLPDPISWVCSLYILGVLVISTVMSVVCWVMIRMEVSKGIRSNNLMRAQGQLNTVLMLQFTIPFLTIHIPFYISFLMPLFRITTIKLSIYLPYLFSWCPALNPVLVLVSIKSLREQLFRKFSRNSKMSSAGNVVIQPRSATPR